MQPFPRGEDYAVVFGRVLAETHTSIRRLANITGISRRTLENWLDGSVRRPREWIHILRVAHALHLPAVETDALLRAAGHPPLVALQTHHYTGPHRDLLTSWQLPGHSLTAKKAALPVLHDLPLAVTPIIGYQEPYQRVESLLRRPEVRLVTVTGLGGVGKTRLALEAARAVADWFEQGVYFIALDTVTSVRGFWDLLARSLNMPRDTMTPVERLVPDYLRNRPVLLLLDNFEHLPELTPIVADLIRRTRHLKLLVTSRQALDLRVEFLVPLTGLSTESGVESPAYALFLRTARRRVPGYTPTAADVDDIQAICKLTEGLPLALELAAAWLDTLRPRRILDRLQSDLTQLNQPAADRPERQHNLWALFDYSFRLLSEAEQEAAMRLSIIIGPFSVSAALAIAGCSSEMLRRLIHASLVQRTEDGRLVLHSLIRQYLLERAQQIGLDEHQLETDYLTHYMGWAGEQGRALREEMSAAAVKQLALEWPHVERAWWLAVEQGRHELLDAAIDLLIFFEAQHAWVEGRAFFKKTQDLTPIDNRRLQARLDEAQAILAIRMFDYQPALQLATKAQAAFAELGVDPATDPAGAYARLTLWAVEYNLGQHDSAPATMDGVFEAAGHHLAKFAQLTYLLLLGVRTAARGDWPGAHTIYRQALDASLPHGYHVPNVRTFLGQSYAQLGDRAMAIEQFEQTRQEAYDLNAYASVVIATFELCYLASEVPTAEACHATLAELAYKLANAGTIGRIAAYCAVVYMTQGLVTKSGLLAWTGLTLLWDSTEPPARASSLFTLAQSYLAFGQIPIAKTLLAVTIMQPSADSETHLMAEAMLAMLGGAADLIPPGQELHVLHQSLVSLAS